MDLAIDVGHDPLGGFAGELVGVGVGERVDIGGDAAR
jgi:hypothetical protein